MEIIQKIRSAGLRPTRQRLALGQLLFEQGDRHLTAEDLHAEAMTCGIALSVATVYNTLRQFTEAGLLRVLSVEGSRTWFDTNVSEHHHFLIEESGEIRDAPGTIAIANLPAPPEGMMICGVDVVIRVRARNCGTRGSASPR